MKSIRRGVRCLWRVGFKTKKSFQVGKLGKNNDGVMDDKSGEDDTLKVR